MQNFFSGALLTLCLLGIAGNLGAQSRKYAVTAGLNAQVFHTAGSSVVDVLIPGVEKMSLDLTQPADGNFLIKTADYNFDGYKDFALAGSSPAGSLQIYDIYLYHPADGVFEALEIPDGSCEAFGNVRLSLVDKTLRSSCKAGTKASLDIFKWADPFSLELVKTTDNSKEAMAGQADEKAERKTEQGAQRKEKRDDLKDRRDEQREQRKEAQEDADD